MQHPSQDQNEFAVQTLRNDWFGFGLSSYFGRYGTVQAEQAFIHADTPRRINTATPGPRYPINTWRRSSS